MLAEIVSGALLLLGAFFLVVAAVGIIRMPDLYLRMSAASKASTLGVGLVLLGTAIHFAGDFGAASRAVGGIAFILLTTPVAAHLIGRAAYVTGVPLWSKTVRDDLKDRYDPETGVLSSPPEYAGTGQGPEGV